MTEQQLGEAKLTTTGTDPQVKCSVQVWPRKGAFNRLSQHLNQGGVDGATRRVDSEVDGERSDAFAGCAVASARSGATVLEVDCDLDYEPESGRSGWSVAGGRHSLVPASWRHAIVYVALCPEDICRLRSEKKLDCCKPKTLVYGRSRAALGEALLRSHES